MRTSIFTAVMFSASSGLLLLGCSKADPMTEPVTKPLAIATAKSISPIFTVSNNSSCITRFTICDSHGIIGHLYSNTSSSSVDYNACPSGSTFQLIDYTSNTLTLSTGHRYTVHPMDDCTSTSGDKLALTLYVTFDPCTPAEAPSWDYDIGNRTWQGDGVYGTATTTAYDGTTFESDYSALIPGCY